MLEKALYSNRGEGLVRPWMCFFICFSSSTREDTSSMENVEEALDFMLPIMAEIYMLIRLLSRCLIRADSMLIFQ